MKVAPKLLLLVSLCRFTFRAQFWLFESGASRQARLADTQNKMSKDSFACTFAAMIRIGAGSALSIQ
jgi:hypothetical protein